MDIRRFTQDDFASSMELAQYAFQMQFDEERLRKQKEQFVPAHWFGAFDEGKLAAQVHVHDMAIYLNGSVMRMGGVAEVSSWPEQRRQGSIGRLIGTALSAMREQGQTVSMLAPFSFAFYRKYGWEMAIDYKRYTIPASLLPDRYDTGGRVERHRGGAELLAGLYAQYAARYNGTLARTADWWERSVFQRKTDQAAVYYSASGEPAGYALYEVKNRELVIHELVALDEPSRRGLWTFFANHDSMVDSATVTAPMDDRLPFLLGNPRIKQEIVPYFMARIVDFAAFAVLYAFREGETASSFTIRLQDRHAPWNEGIWRLTVQADGSVSVRPADSSEEAAPDLDCDIQTASALWFGYQTPAELRACGRLTAGDEAIRKLERLLPPRTTYLMDFF